MEEEENQYLNGQNLASLQHDLWFAMLRIVQFVYLHYSLLLIERFEHQLDNDETARELAPIEQSFDRKMQ